MIQNTCFNNKWGTEKTVPKSFPAPKMGDREGENGGWLGQPLPGFLPSDWDRGPTFSKPNPRPVWRACRVESERSSAALKFFTLSSSKREHADICLNVKNT